ncbi:MAG TPA: hypothetical protein VEJ67_09960 [Candidatus Cybelea sp.]|nr:hypothetical protein [Candidatus Cybelea sp.]
MHKNIRFGVPCFALVLFFACSLVARAQDTGTQQSTSQAQAQTAMHQGQHANRLEWLSKQLNLTDEQKAKVKSILGDEGKQMQTAREDTSLSQAQKQDKMKEIHANADSQINDLLTTDQQKKFAELKAQMKSHQGTKPDEPKQPQ